MKHMQESKKKPIKKIILVVLIALIVALIIFLVLNNGGSIDESQLMNTVTNEIEEIVYDEHGGDELVTVDTVDYPESVSGYSVIGKIEIDKIDIQSYIFEKTTKASLKLGATKFWGPDINEPGNICISGHNYQKLFGKLKNLSVR